MNAIIEQILFFSRDSVKITKTLSGIRIMLKGCNPLGKSGYPAFPGKIIRVALPFHHKALSVKEEVIRSSRLTEQAVLVACNQEPRYVYLDKNRRLVTSGNPMAMPDGKAYDDAIQNKKACISLLRTEWISNVPVAVLQVTPVRYNLDGTIELLEILKVTIEMEKYTFKSHVPLKMRLKRDQNLGKVHRMVANPQLIESIKLTKADSIDQDEITEDIQKSRDMTPQGIYIPDEVDYLIITDNQQWNADTITPGIVIGDMVTEFKKLVAWKKQRGLRTHIATIKDIVGGVYGDFKSSALDLQEVIRNFLKAFCAQKGVEWVLIGGDVNIVPVRQVCASAANRIDKGEVKSGNIPDGELSGDNTTAWKGSYLAMRVRLWSTGNPEFGQLGDILSNYDTGEIIPFDSVGTSNSTTLGWYFTTDDTFSTRSVAKTQWIRINGPAAKINATMIWYNHNNRIPTDLYYSSLYSSWYQTGKHDWYHLNNGLFGQHNHINPHLSGIDYFANIGLGRAPVETPAEAAVFVNKVLTYEKWDQNPILNSIERFRKMLYVSDNWGAYFRIYPSVGNVNPPANEKYYNHLASGLAVLHQDKLPPDAGMKLICHISDTNRRELHYSSHASKDNPGWYYAKSDTDLSASSFKMWGFDIPIPTPWIVIHTADPSELTPIYYALDFEGADSSMTQQETLREWMQSFFYEIDQVQRLYTDETDLSSSAYNETSIRHLTSENLKTAMNEGLHFISFSGHGNSDWVAYLTSDLVNQLNNGNKTSIIFADSCSTNEFDVNDSVGENCIKYPNGGAVAYIGNSRFSWIGLGDLFRLEFFKTMIYSRHLADMNDSRCAFAGNSSDIYYLWVILAQNLNGDPEMPVFRTDNDAVPRFIGNWNTGELHRQTCQWVGHMSYFHRVQFNSVEEGLHAGYDGCYFCLKPYHTK